MKKKLPIKTLMAQALMALLVMMAMTTAARAQTAYAVYCEDNTTFYFTYRTEALSVGDTFTPEEENATPQRITALWSGTDVTETGTNSPGWDRYGDHGAFVPSVKTVVFEPSFANVKPKSTLAWFVGFESLTGIQGMEYLNTSQVTNMSYMFFYCGSLTSLDLSPFDTSSVTDMNCMFDGCGSLTSLNLSSFDTKNVTDMQAMFHGCGSLTSLDLSSFDTKNVTDMSFMFYECDNLTFLDLSSFDTRSVTDMNSMFSLCGSLTSLDLSSFDTRSVTNMFYMFNNCSNLRDIFIGNEWDTEYVESFEGMFSFCSSLPNWDGSTGTEHAHAGDDGYMLIHPMLTIEDDYDDNTTEISNAISAAQERYDDIYEEDEEDNHEAEAAIAKKNNVTLSGRTLYRDGEWNTLCLPFGMTARQIAASPLAGADIRTLTSASVTGYTVRLTFGEVSSLTAGTPYIVRWTKSDDYEAYDGTNAETTDDIVDPVFNGVTLSDEKHDFTSEDTHVDFVGYYDAFKVTSDDALTVYYLSTGNTLKHTATARTLKACRAYFTFTPDDGAGANDFTFDIDFGDGTTAIYQMEDERLMPKDADGAWYTPDGRKLSGEPTRKGIYLSNGRKVVIK